MNSAVIQASAMPGNGERRVIRKVAAASFIGNFVEWFDYASYAYLATIIAHVFFPEASPTAGLMATFGVFALSFVVRPIGGVFWGHYGDRIGRKPVLMFFGIAGTLLTVPILTTLAGTKSAWTAFLLICGAWIFTAGYTSINAVVKAELFPTAVRATGVAVPYAVTVSIFGGTAPAIALFFKQQGHEQWFFYYLAGMIFISFLVYALMRDTKHTSAMQRHE